MEEEIIQHTDKKQKKRWRNMLIFFLFLIGVSFLAYGFMGKYVKTNSSSITPTPSFALSGYISYSGHVGFSALEILKEKAQVEESAPGVVVGINGTKTDLNQHQAWSFFVNGKLSNTNPADYQTKESDFIEWKIERY